MWICICEQTEGMGKVECVLQCCKVFRGLMKGDPSYQTMYESLEEEEEGKEEKFSACKVGVNRKRNKLAWVHFTYKFSFMVPPLLLALLEVLVVVSMGWMTLHARLPGDERRERERRSEWVFWPFPWKVWACTHCVVTRKSREINLQIFFARVISEPLTCICVYFCLSCTACFLL